MDDSIAFLPFHALNEFMRVDYRQDVVRTALTALPDLPESFRFPIERLTRQYVSVPGFRNSAKAPLNARIRPTGEAFGKSPHLVAAVLAVWAEVKSDLRQKMFDLLTSRGWELLPPDADRTQLPGFLPTWPKDDDFEVINKAFNEMYPEAGYSEDDISLMAVWMSVRLPYQLEGDDEDDEEYEEYEGEVEDEEPEA